MTQIDARGKACPLPVIEAKKAVEAMSQGIVEVLVDNSVAVQNVLKMAKQKNLAATSEQKEGYYVVAITVTEQSPTCEIQQTMSEADSQTQNTVVVLSSDTMGNGDDVLGRLLMKGFVYALTEQDQLPKTIVLYNGGAKLSIQGAETLEDLKLMESQGVEILTCGTCLNHYGIADQLAVGSVTNMYRIAEVLTHAGKVIRP